MSDFNYINIMDIDPTFQPVAKGPRTLEVTKLTPKTYIGKPGSKYEGQEQMLINGSFTVVDDAEFNGRRIFQTLFASSAYDLKGLRRLADATGVTQETGETFSDWLSSFEQLNPPARFKAFVDVVDKPDREGNIVPTNVISFSNVKPA